MSTIDGPTKLVRQDAILGGLSIGQLQLVLTAVRSQVQCDCTNGWIVSQLGLPVIVCSFWGVWTSVDTKVCYLYVVNGQWCIPLALGWRRLTCGYDLQSCFWNTVCNIPIMPISHYDHESQESSRIVKFQDSWGFVIPLLHYNHESHESPRIDNFFGFVVRGISIWFSRWWFVGMFP